MKNAKAKRILSILLSVSLLVTQLPVEAIAATTQQTTETVQTTEPVQNPVTEPVQPKESVQTTPESLPQEQPGSGVQEKETTGLEALPMESSDLLNDDSLDVAPVESTEASVIDNPIKNTEKIIGELTEKRESNVKHFLKENNTYEAVLYPSPVHYFKDNKWKDINNDFVEEVDKGNNPVLRNKDNDFQVKIAKKLKSKNLITITKDKYEITWDMVDINPSIGEKKQKDLAKYNKLSSNEKKKSLLHLDSTVLYEEAYQDVDVEYSIVSQSIKENIIIKSPTALEKDFITAYYLKTKNLKIEKQKDNSILFLDENNPENIVFKMDAPFMFDASGEISNDVAVMVEKDSNGVIITYVPDMKWLRDEKRTFPITIDPTVTTSIERSDIQDANVSEGFPSTNYQNSMYIKTGYGSSSLKNRSFMKFTLPNLTSADTITYAQLELFTALTKGNAQVDLHKVTSTWNSSTITWANQPSYSSSIIDDYANITTTQSLYTWEITKMVRDWYTTGINNGLMIKNKDEAGAYTDYYSSDVSATYEAFRPMITLMYINNTGLEDYWTYHSQDLGRAGTGYVNDFNGNLVFLHDDITSTGSRMPVSINHVYNSNVSTDIGYGKGWRLNLSQTVTKKTIDSVIYSVYTDEDGTIHYLKDVGGGIYEDEEGINLTLTENTASTEERYVIKDKEGNTLTFDSTGKLKKITDNNKNRIHLTYTNNLLTSAADGVDRVVNLSYVNGKLNTITDPSGRATTYNYTANNLTSIQYPDGKSSKYTYDTFFKAENIDGYQINYVPSTSSPKKVIRVEESNKDGTLGGLLNIAYAKSATAFTDYQNKKTIYQFNNQGNTVSIENEDGYAQYYDFIESGKNVNRINTSSKLQKTIINLARNHNFEVAGYWNFALLNGATGSGSFVTENKYSASQSAKISKTNTAGEARHSQSLTLVKGKTYTLSGYIKTQGVTSTSSKGATVGVIYKDASGIDKTVYSTYASGTKDWERQEVTFTLPSNSTSTSVTIMASILSESGTAYFDAMQLEEGNISNRYNMVENSDLTYQTSGTPEFWTKLNCDANDVVATTTNPSIIDDSTMKIIGNGTANKYIRQIINSPGKQGDTFVYSG